MVEKRNFNMSEEEQIEEILEEANAYNLRLEVEAAAEKIYGEKNTQFHVFSLFSLRQTFNVLNTCIHHARFCC